MAALAGSVGSSRRRSRPALRSRIAPPRRASTARETAEDVTSLRSKAHFASRGPIVRSLTRPRPGPLILAFLLTTVWLFANVRRISPLDVLPFAWTWLTVWLFLSVGLDLWRRSASLARRDRRHR